jgi:hypothetical protein
MPRFFPVDRAATAACRGKPPASSGPPNTRTRRPIGCRLAPLALVSALAIPGAHAGEWRNWFDDPFFQITGAIPHCPEPAGPRVTEAERRAQSHRRAEKGTTCWLANEPDCARSNAYSYDRDIAAEIRAVVREQGLFARTTLWITVQGRIVFVEGCVPKELEAREIEAAVRNLPHVQQAIAIVTDRPNSKPPYRLVGTR